MAASYDTSETGIRVTKPRSMTDIFRKHCKSLFQSPFMSSPRLHKKDSVSVPDGLQYYAKRQSDAGFSSPRQRSMTKIYEENPQKKKQAKTRPVSDNYLVNNEAHTEKRSRKISLPAKWLTPLHQNNNSKNHQADIPSNNSTSSLPAFPFSDYLTPSDSIPGSDVSSLNGDISKFTQLERHQSITSFSSFVENKDQLSEENYSYFERQLQEWISSTQMSKQTNFCFPNTRRQRNSSSSKTSIVSAQTSFEQDNEEQKTLGVVNEARSDSLSPSDNIVFDFPNINEEGETPSLESIKQHVKGFLETEIQSVVLDKNYHLRFSKKWCKNISVTIMNRLINILNNSCKVIVNVCIGHKRDDTNLTVLSAYNSANDCFVTVCFEVNDMYIWATLLLVPYQ